MLILQVLNKLTRQLWQNTGKEAVPEPEQCRSCCACPNPWKAPHLPHSTHNFLLPTPVLQDLPPSLLSEQRHSMRISSFSPFSFPAGNRGHCAKGCQCETCYFSWEMLLVEGMRKRFTDDDDVLLGTVWDNVTHINGENGYQVVPGWQAWLVPLYASGVTCQILRIWQYYYEANNFQV